MIRLNEQELKIVTDILKKYVLNYEVFVFGSRHSGNIHKHSDLDLAIKANDKIDILLLANIRDDFQNSNLPFRVDIVDFNNVSTEFQKIILENCTVLDCS